MGHLDYRNGVSIAEIVVYVPSLLIAGFLAFRHGFGRNSGWIYLIIFCLVRILGSSTQLATIANPRSTGLYTSSAIFNNIALSPLTLASLGFLSRLLSSISKTRQTIIHPRMIRIIQLVIVVGMALGIAGGINAADAYIKTLSEGSGGHYVPSSLNKAGTALFIVSYAALLVFLAVTYPSVQHAEPGEKRIFLALALSMPFIFIRLVYSCFSTFTTRSQFNLLDGSTTILLCVALIEEFICVVIYEATGLTLQKAVKAEQHVEAATELRNLDSNAQLNPGKPSGGNRALNIAKRTIIGRIVMAFIPDKS